MIFFHAYLLCQHRYAGLGDTWIEYCSTGHQKKRGSWKAANEAEVSAANDQKDDNVEQVQLDNDPRAPQHVQFKVRAITRLVDLPIDW